ncbi:MAG: hypothetical protein N3B01_00845, partial [Verrucomicrobiae bacterium]|nr:hypothetical protein [Verrucomicrobiae bacterium]
MKTAFALRSVLVCLFVETNVSAAEHAIVVRTNVPYGNAANLRVQPTKRGAEVRFTPNPHGGPECLWFCFRVCRAGASRIPLGTVRLLLECAENMLGGGRPENFRPVYRVTRGDWHRAGAPELIVLADGRREAAWSFDVRQPTLDFAFSFPYGRENVELLLRDTKGY